MNNLKNKVQNVKVGNRFGDLIVLEKEFESQVKCFCMVKNEIVFLDIDNLLNQNKKSSKRKKLRIADINEKHEQLTVTDNKPIRGKYGQILIQVRCSCGTQKYVKNYDFVSRKIASCGCLKKVRVREAAKTHGLYKSKEYKAWLRIKTICLNQKDPSYERYGGIGIDVDPQWINSFQRFYNDMGPCPKDSIITRIDPAKGFFAYNCCWLSRSESKKIQILIERGANPEVLIPPKLILKAENSDRNAINEEKIAAIRDCHKKGESNITVLSQKFNVSVNEVVSILIPEI